MKSIAATPVLLVMLALALPGGAGAQVVDELSRRQALQHYRAGIELMTAERFEQAAAEFTSAIQFDPLLTIAHYSRGQAYMALARFASAVQAFLAGRTAFDTIAHLRQRDAAEVTRLQTDEIHELRDSMRRVQSSQVRVDAGTLFRIQQRLEELETLRRGRNFADASLQVPAELLLALGSAYYRNRQLADAEREWREAVRINPRLGEAHNNLAALYAMTGRPEAARASIEAAERARFRVHPQLKEDIRRMLASR